MGAFDEEWRAAHHSVVRQIGPNTIEEVFGAPSSFKIAEEEHQERLTRARLAAAAPELYRALKRCEWADGCCHVCVYIDGHTPDCDIGLAIAKAEGR